MEITTKQLANALSRQWVYAENRDGTHHAQIVNPDEVARELWEKLAGHADPDATSERADVVEAHVCCEHVPATRASHELRTVDQIVALLDHRGQRVTRRVLRWVWDYLTDDDEPPF